ncbi:hypothetical protein ACFQBQ_02065 [Granulicella cerasi]|uniref:NHL repeat containing protein n=1 Tax=Granulicella cerasi TaxID=741063 RepID=A0ABW1Z6U9_9BACT|nr:hypothetical protein [Granulicella cerasi]
MKLSKVTFLALSGALLPAILGGCADDGTITTKTTTPLLGAQISGKVMAGSTPVAGAHVYLFAAGTGGYGTTSTSLLSTGQSGVTADSNANGYVTAGSDGSYALAGDYNCPTATSQIYLVATGGNPGQATGTNNTGITFVAGLGSCAPLSNNTVRATAVINEMTTVATAYALAQFTTNAQQIASGTVTTGITNAFNLIPVLVTLSTGASNASTGSSIGAIPQTAMASLANLLNTCASTSGATSTACAALFAAATPAGVTAPSNTFQAALNLAHYPGNQVAALYTLSKNASAYTSALAAQPNDWTLSIAYTTTTVPGISTPQQVAIDASGNAWIVNYNSNALVEISPIGSPVSPLTGPGGYSGPVNNATRLAIDLSGNVWTIDGQSDISEFSSTGSVVQTQVVQNIPSPSSIAVDPSNNIWIANKYTANNLFELSNAAKVISPATGYATSCLQYTNAVAIDTSSNVWMGGQNSTCLAEFDKSGNVLSGTAGFNGGGMAYNTYGGIAFDHSGNVWVPSTNGALSVNKAGVISEFTSTGTAITSSAGYTSGGIFNPTGLAIDGIGNVWVTNGDSTSPPTTTKARLSVISSVGAGVSPTTGYMQGTLGALPYAPAIDPSGNVWIPESTTSTVYQVIGAAAPVVTPLAAAVKNNQLGVRP